MIQNTILEEKPLRYEEKKLFRKQPILQRKHISWMKLHWLTPNSQVQILDLS